MEGVAAAEPFQAQTQTPPKAVPTESLRGKVGTAGDEPAAVGKQRWN